MHSPSVNLPNHSPKATLPCPFCYDDRREERGTTNDDEPDPSPTHDDNKPDPSPTTTTTNTPRNSKKKRRLKKKNWTEEKKERRTTAKFRRKTHPKERILSNAKMELSVSPHLLTSPCTSSSSLLLKTRVRVSQTTLIPPRFQQLPLCSAHPRHILSPMDARQSTVTRASLVEDIGSPITSSTPEAGARIGEVKRVTKETNVAVRINLDGLGIADSSTGIPFLDHMLDQLASHGLFDVHVRATGDIHIDDRHTIEDVALAIGTALLHGLGDRKGINRFGDFSAPLDEAVIHVSLDLSGRPHLSYDLCIPTERVGTYDTQLVEHFFQSLVNTSGMTLHIRQLAGKNSHHIIEATFKAFARALRQATEYDPRRRGTVPSSKGVLSRT